MKRNTQQAIVDEFIDEVERSSLSQVRIANIIEKLSLNRNTFYYHYSSKFEVALWVLQRNLDEYLRAAFSEHELVLMPPAAKSSSHQPIAYYAHVETGARTLDCSKFLKTFVCCTLNKKQFFRKLFAPQELEFRQCLVNLYVPAIENDILFILDGRYMPDETRHMLALMGSRYLISTVGFCLESSEPEVLLDDKSNPFWNILHESLYTAIQSHPINRYTTRS